MSSFVMSSLRQILLKWSDEESEADEAWGRWETHLIQDRADSCRLGDDRPDDGGSKDLWNVGELLPD
jgi:hypothetical protein